MAVLPDAIAEMVGTREDIAVLMQAVNDDPAMLAQHLVVYERNAWLEQVIAERTDTDRHRDLAPRLMAAMVATVLRKSIEMWAEGDTDAALPDLILRSLAHVGAGLPQSA
jgi:hypothetical protein